MNKYSGPIIIYSIFRILTLIICSISIGSIVITLFEPNVVSKITILRIVILTFIMLIIWYIVERFISKSTKLRNNGY